MRVDSCRTRYVAYLLGSSPTRWPPVSHADRQTYLRRECASKTERERSLVEARATTRGVETSGSIHLARKQHSLNAMPSTPATKSVSRTTEGEARVSTKRRNAAECAPSSKPPTSRPTYASRKNAFALAQQRAGQRRQLLELQTIKCLTSAPDRVRTPSKRQSKALHAEV